MDPRAAQEALEELVPEYVHLMCLDDWTIRLRCDRLDDTDQGDTAVAPEYEDATITLDPREVNSEEELDRLVRHELLHVLTGDFQSFLDFVEKGSSGPVQRLFEEKGREVWERIVRRLEKAWDRLYEEPEI